MTDLRVIEDARLDARSGATARLLGGLEDEAHVPARGATRLREHLRYAQGYRYVGVVATGMHDPGVGGRPRLARSFGNWQGVDIRSPGDTWARAAPPD